jgi:hypothetical protein
VALTINGYRVEDDVVEQEFSVVKAHFESLGNIQCCERNDEFLGYAKDNVIGQVLLFQEAERTIEVPPDTEIDEALSEMETEYGSREAMCYQLGVDQDDLSPLRDQLSRRLRVERLVHRMCADLEPDAPAAPDEATLRTYYDKNIDQFMSTPQVRASHILKSPARSEQTEEVYESMVDARHRLLEGADFRKIASEISDKAAEAAAAEGEEAEQLGDGIDLGFFARGELMEEFERVAFSMKIGEISPVFYTTYGFHILALTDRHDATAEPFDQILDDVREAYGADQRQDRVTELVDRLKAEADIQELEEPDEDEDEDAVV